MLLDIILIYVYAAPLTMTKMRKRLMTKREFSLIVAALILTLSTFAYAPGGLGMMGRVLGFAPAASLAFDSVIANTTHIAIWVRNVGVIDLQLHSFYVDEVLICESNSSIHAGECKKYLIAANTTIGQAYDVEIVCTDGTRYSHRFVASEGTIIPNDDWSPLIEYDTAAPPTNPDSDGDGMPDWWEYEQGLNPQNASDAHEDPDEDGLSNLEEYTYQTNLREADTDGDGLSDGLEVHVFCTDPLEKDTDGDGISDGLEAAAAGFDANVIILPKNWIKVNLLWSNYTMDVLTNSSVFGITFDSTDKQLTVNVAGADGTIGVCNLTVPTSLVSSISDVEIYLDGQHFNFSISDHDLYYYISVEYEHSSHVLLANFESSATTNFDYIPYVFIGALMTISCVAAILLRKMHVHMPTRKRNV